MFSKEQIDTLYYLVEKGVVSAEAVNAFLKTKLEEVGLREPEPPVAPEAPAEPVPPAPEQPAA